MRNLQLVILLILLGCTACEKYSLENGQKRLPNQSERGRGMFACYIDNETYIAKRQEEVVYNRKTGYLFLNNSNAGFEFRLFVYEGIFSEGNYEFDITNEDFVLWSPDEVFFGIDPQGKNDLIITKLDLEKEIISGVFDLDLKAEDGTKKNITDGRFDLEISVII